MSIRVRDVMTKDVSTVAPDEPLWRAAKEIIEQRYSGMPVVDKEENLVGVVEVEDFLPKPSQVPFTRIPVLEFQGEWIEEDQLQEFARALENMRVKQVMRESLPTIHQNAPVGAALDALVQLGGRRLLVIDDDEKLVGVVTRTDLLRVLSGGV